MIKILRKLSSSILDDLISSLGMNYLMLELLVDLYDNNVLIHSIFPVLLIIYENKILVLISISEDEENKFKSRTLFLKITNV